MSTKELAENFPDGQEINQVRNGKKAMPSDPALRMVYLVQIERQHDKKERLQEAAKNSAPLEPDGPGKTTATMEPTVSAAKLAPEEEDQDATKRAWAVCRSGCAADWRSFLRPAFRENRQHVARRATRGRQFLFAEEKARTYSKACL